MALLHKGDLELRRLELGPYGNNCYIITCSRTRESVIVDTPTQPEAILEAVRGLQVVGILLTHNHPDHIQALAEVKTGTGAPVAAHPDDAKGLPVAADRALADGEMVQFGSQALRVLYTPGHTPGSLCFLAGNFLVSGDTIFPGGPGKSRTPAHLAQIIHSLQDRVFLLPDDTLVYPGHGADTVLGKEKEQFRVFLGRTHDPGLCGDVLWLSC